MGIYEQGVKVWLPDKEKVWICGEIQSNKDGVLTIIGDDGQERTKKEKDEPFLKNPDMLEAVDDLTSLSYLHEPAVLHTLKTRYDLTNIYTYCGIVLVAINPFQKLDIYNQELIRQYRGKQVGELEPHLFALAEDAYNNMSTVGKNQSIVVSGESGAGKTVSAKFCMRYFAIIGGGSGEESGEIEERVLASNPVMESFGNAKTTRNDNSSRFGKYTTLQFDKENSICGASMKTYLLEKSRVVNQGERERGYHIFYQLCASAYENCDPQLESFQLQQSQKFRYLKGGNSPTVDGIDDVEEYKETVEAMKLVGISKDEIQLCFSVLAAILHIGNINIHTVSARNDDAKVDLEKDENLKTVCSLLNVPIDDFSKWLIKKNVKAGREIITKILSASQASDSRDALSKHVYSKIFDWVVMRVNQKLEAQEHKGKFIGVLDIYGFEIFKINSFEQFCINYANEKLQQQFNQHVFKLEQEEYVKEEIEWSFINFYDNQPCIDLIEQNMGILALLNEEARMIKGSNESFLNKLKNTHKGKPNFEVPRMGNDSFTIKHFAASVCYLAEGFLEKNRDSVSEELVGLLEKSEHKFLQMLFANKDLEVTNTSSSAISKTPTGGGGTKKGTVGSAFKTSLQDLMATIYQTQPHYCRCLKPNDNKMAFQFETVRIVDQLRACGVLETIRISAAGFPSRWEYNEFFHRYSLLCKSHLLKNKELLEICELILNQVLDDKEKYQFGKTKVFFRAGQVAYMEKLRTNRIKECIGIMQKNVRGYLYSIFFRKMRKAQILLSRHIRAFLARKFTQKLRMGKAAIKIQKNYRSFYQSRKYKNIMSCIVLLQTFARKIFAIEEYKTILWEKSAITIQSCVRMYKCKCDLRLTIRGIVQLQTRYRCILAKRELRELKTAAKDVKNLQTANLGLEQKIMDLQRIIDTQKESFAKLQRDFESKEKANTIALENKIKGLTKQVEETTEDISIWKTLNQKQENENEILNEKLQNQDDLLNNQYDIINTSKTEMTRILQENEKWLQEIQELKKLNTSLEEQLLAKSKYTRRTNKSGAALESSLSLQNEKDADNNNKRKRKSIGHDLNTIDTSSLKSATYVSMPVLNLSDISINNDDSDSKLTIRNRKASIDSYTKLKDFNGEGEKRRFSMRNLGGGSEVKEKHVTIVCPAEKKELEGKIGTLESELAARTAEKETIELRLQNLQKNQDDDDLKIQIDQLLNERAQLSITLTEERRGKSENEDEMRKLKEELKCLQKEKEEGFRSRGWDGSTNSIVLPDDSLRAQLKVLTAENEALTISNKELMRRLDNKAIESNFENRINHPRRTASVLANKNSSEHNLAYNNQESQQLLQSLFMFKFSEEHEGLIIQQLINDADHVKLCQEPRGVVAHILFMCVRYCDYLNDPHRLQSLLTNLISSIQHVIMRKNLDIELLAFWFSNSFVLLNDMYLSECEGFIEYELENFDLSEYRQVIEDLAMRMYIALVRIVQDTLTEMVVGCILESEKLHGVMSSGMKKRGKKPNDKGTVLKIEDILTVLTNVYDLLLIYNVPTKIISELYIQVSYFISTVALNNLLLRKELCHWSKGLQINYNIAQLEQWFRDKNFDEAMPSLIPIGQAIKLLQMQKADKKDAVPILQTCDCLNYLQIQKILKLYTPDTYEEKVPADLIREIEYQGKSQGEVASLMTDVEHVHPIQIPYTDVDELDETMDVLTEIYIPNFLELDEILTRMGETNDGGSAQ